MTPREFLPMYRFDRRMVTGEFYTQKSIQIDPGDRVGVVLFNLGGPTNLDGVEPFLYNLFMDPAIIDIPLPAFLRDPLCRYIARKRSRKVRDEYALIGGESPLNRHTRKQAELLEECLNEDLGDVSGAHFKVYQAMRYAPPLTEGAVAEMKRDGVNKVVLLPLYPQYSKTTTGAALVYWKALEKTGVLPTLPTALVFEYAAHPSLIRAFSQRIDEALARFPENVRDEVVILFSAHGTPLYEMKKRRDPYCCLIHTTVDRIMKYRQGDLPYRIAFQSKVGPVEWLTPSTPDTLEAIARDGVKNVLVVPIAFVSDHVETEFELGIEVRTHTEEMGIERFEIITGLNESDLFIEVLTDCAKRAVSIPGYRPESCLQNLKQIRSKDRSTQCHQCQRNAEAVCWNSCTEQADPIHTG